MSEKIIVLKVGGSILSKSEEELFDFETAKSLKNLLVPFINEGYKFILSTGGGAIARKYQAMTRAAGFSRDAQDRIGIEACNVNATMLRVVFEEYARPMVLALTELISNEPVEFGKYSVLLVGAAKPGHSSDVDATEIAIRANAKTVISLKNVDGVYSEDPNNNPEAKKYDRLSWSEYGEIMGTDIFTPGGHYPVDPVASRLAKENRMKFVIVDGADLENLEQVIKGEHFIGTIIS